MHTHTHHTCTHTHTPHAHTYHIHIHTGLRITTQNGFMNGVTEEGHTDTDVYPDGPLTSGTHSLRRIKTTTQTARMMTRVGCLSVCLSVCLYLYISVSLFLCFSVPLFLASFYHSISLTVYTFIILQSVCPSVLYVSGGREGWKRRVEEKGGREGWKRREEKGEREGWKRREEEKGG